MALTAGHKWKLSCVYGNRLPNFLMLSYCRWQINAPFFSSQGTAAVKAGLQTGGHIGPLPREEAPLAVLSQATSISDTAAVGAATTTKDLPTPNINEGRMPPITEPGEGQPDSQAACSRDPNQQHPPHGRGQRHISVLLRTLRNARSSESPRNLLS